MKQKTLREDAHSREAETCRKRPRSARECAKAHSFLLKKSVLDKKPPGGKIDSSAWRLLKHQKYCFVWEKCDYSASFA